MALSFDITYGFRVPLIARHVVSEVASDLASAFSDPVTINLTVRWGSLEGALGESFFGVRQYNYGQIVGALAADARSNDDASTVATLPWADPIAGPHSWTVTTAQAKALGLLSGHSGVSDGTVIFSNNTPFDFNPENGITPGRFDFYGVVAHEITEVMGRELNDNPTDVASGTSYHPLDLLKYAAPEVHSFAGTTPGYFSVNDGSTALADFNTDPQGDFGDWASGIHDSFLAFASPGVLNPVSAFDLRAMDVIGWDRAAGGASRPATIAHGNADGGMVLAGTTASDSFNFAAPSGNVAETHFDLHHDATDIAPAQLANFAAALAEAGNGHGDALLAYGSNPHGEVVSAEAPHHTTMLQHANLAALHAANFHLL